MSFSLSFIARIVYYRGKPSSHTPPPPPREAPYHPGQDYTLFGFQKQIWESSFLLCKAHFFQERRSQAHNSKWALFQCPTQPLPEEFEHRWLDMFNVLRFPTAQLVVATKIHYNPVNTFILIIFGDGNVICYYVLAYQYFVAQLRWLLTSLLLEATHSLHQSHISL